MSNGHHQLDVASTLAAHFFLSDFHTAAVADNSFIADALILAASTLVVLRGAEDALAEKAVALGFVGTVVNGLGLGYLAEGTFLDFLGRSQSDGNLGETTLYF